jgi:radical SAM superfamily enzyme
VEFLLLRVHKKKLCYSFSALCYRGYIEDIMKKIKLPSTFNTINKDERNTDTLDLNSIFWEYLFSTENVKSLFDGYISEHNPTDEFRSYLDFIIAHLNTTNLIKEGLFSIPFEEKRALYCFKTYFFILSIYNKMKKDYQISLPYGVIFNYPVENIERFISDDKNVISDIFDKVLSSNKFFENNSKYILKIYWENESYVMLLLAHMMRKKFDKIEISVDLDNVNEQVDFSFWKSHHLFNKYIDNFENVYYEDDSKEGANNSKQIVDIGFNNKKLATRLFNTKCYWGKCSFCSINSRFTSEKRVENLNEYAVQKIDDLIVDIKKTEGLFSMVFTDEAIEASILIYFAEQLLKYKIDIKWSVRSRFSDKFTLDLCKILARSGLRFLGFGLESVNQRILQLMNKRERKYPKEELNNIFENCDRVGINAHAYFIIGFPSETKKETDETLEFIDYQLKNRKYFTYSANVFYLMKGSDVYNRPEKYNIKINDKYESIKLSDISFIDNNPGEKYTRNELAYLSRRAYSKLFFKENDLDYSTIQIGYHFWDFLDRTTLFYEYKLVNSCNPYLYELDIEGLNDKIRNQNFKLLPLFISSNDSNCEYYNILNEKRVTINASIKDIFIFFVTNFKPDVTLRENIDVCFNNFCINEDAQNITQIVETINRKNIFEKYIIKLIKDSLLYTSPL